jgi:Protein of unknown function (DUF2939)
MRWIFSILAVLVVAWVLFLASPFLSLYRLANAVDARDAAAIEERMDMTEVRSNFARQLIDEYLHSLGKAGAVAGLDRQIAAQASATLADPLVAQLVTPEALIDLLDDGWPQRMVSAEGKPAGRVTFGIGSLSRAWRLFVTSENRGFRKIYVILPDSRPVDERFRLLMRLSGTTWRVTSIDLPHTLLQNLVKKLPRNAAALLR